MPIIQNAFYPAAYSISSISVQKAGCCKDISSFYLFLINSIVIEDSNKVREMLKSERNKARMLFSHMEEKRPKVARRGTSSSSD